MTTSETENLKMFKELIFAYGTACEKAIDHNLDASTAEGAAYEKVTAFLLTQLRLARADERKQAYEEGKNAAVDYLRKNAETVYNAHAVPFLAVNELLLQNAIARKVNY